MDGRHGARIVDVADVGEDALLVHDEARTDPSLAFMLSRLARGPHEPTPIGVFRAVDRPEYGSEVNRQLADAVESQRPRRPRRRSCTRARPGRSTARAGASAPASRGCGTPGPVFGLGWKNVVFGGMRSPPWAMASIWATVAGRSSTPAWASPDATAARDVVDAVLEAELVLREARRGRRRGGSSRGRGRRPARRAAGRSSTSRSGSTSARQPASTMARA